MRRPGRYRISCRGWRPGDLPARRGHGLLWPAGGVLCVASSVHRCGKCSSTGLSMTAAVCVMFVLLSADELFEELVAADEE